MDLQKHELFEKMNRLCFNWFTFSRFDCIAKNDNDTFARFRLDCDVSATTYPAPEYIQNGYISKISI